MTEHSQHEMLQRGLIWFMALVLLGGSESALRVVAWTGMVATRTQQLGFSTAVSTTFDGLHPCALCRAIAAMNTSEHQSGPATPGKHPAPTPLIKKIDQIPQTMQGVADQCTSDSDVLRMAMTARVLRYDQPSPEPPPPRVAL
jgi:hypothetical protein